MVLLVAVVTGCVSTVAPARPTGLPRLPAPSQVWDVEHGWVELPAAPATAPTERWRTPLAAGGRFAVDGVSGVIVVAEPGPTGTVVRRIDAGTGATTWTATAAAGNVTRVEVAGPPKAPVASVWVAAPDGSTQLTVLDAADSRPLSQSLVADGTAFVSATAELVLIGTVQDTVGVDRATATQRWRSDREVHLQDGSLLIEDVTSKTYGVLDPATGTPRWERPRELFSDATITGDLVIVTQDQPGQTDSAAAYDLATGAPRWAAPARLPNVGWADVVGLTPATVLVEGGEPGAFSAALDRDTGALRWQVPSVIAAVLTGGDAPLVLGRVDRRVAVFDGASGTTRATAELANTLGPTIAGGVLYARDNNDVVALGLPDLVERWRVPGAAGADRTVPAAFTAGFVAASTERGPGELVGFIG